MAEEQAAPKQKRAAKRRNYQRELAELQGRVEATMRLLQKMDGLTVEAVSVILRIALETLSGRDT